MAFQLLPAGMNELRYKVSHESPGASASALASTLLTMKPGVLTATRRSRRWGVVQAGAELLQDRDGTSSDISSPRPGVV